MARSLDERRVRVNRRGQWRRRVFHGATLPNRDWHLTCGHISGYPQGFLFSFRSGCEIMSKGCNFSALRQAMRKVTQLYDQALAPVNLRATQHRLLLEIERLGPIAINPLAESMVMDRATLGHNLRPLEERGLVRLAVGQDRRSREVRVTEAGRNLLVEAQKLWRKAQDSFEGTVGREQAAALRDAHKRVAASDFMLD